MKVYGTRKYTVPHCKCIIRYEGVFLFSRGLFFGGLQQQLIGIIGIIGTCKHAKRMILLVLVQLHTTNRLFCILLATFHANSAS